MSDKYIQFIANYDDWQSIKKLKIEPATDPVVVVEFLASLTISVDKKVEQNLSKIVSLKGIDEAITSAPKGKSGNEVADVLAFVAGSKMSRAISEATEKLGESGMLKPQIKEVEELIRVYAMRKVLKNAGLMFSYDQVSLKIPGVKKNMLKKTE